MSLLQYIGLALRRLRGCMTEPHARSEGMLLFATSPRTAMHLAQAPCEASILISISSLCVVNLCLGFFKPVLAPLPNLCMVLAASRRVLPGC